VGERDEGGEGITSASAQALQPARPKRNEEIGVPWGPGFGCFKVRASQALGLGQCSKLEKLQPKGAARPSGHLRKRALYEIPFYLVYLIKGWCAKKDTPSILKYLSLLTFSCNFDHSSYSKNYCKYVKGQVKLKISTIIKHVVNKIDDTCTIF
jgi:hypothetical protein